MICKRYLHPTVLTFKNGISKCFKNRTILIFRFNRVASCCYHDRPNILFTPNKHLYVPKLQSNQYVAFNSCVRYSATPGLPVSSSYDDTNHEDLDLRGKVFEENESSLHHKVMEDSSLYSSTVFKSNSNFSDKYYLNENELNDLLSTSDWESKSPHHIAAAFVSFGLGSSKYLNVNVDDDRFTKLINEFEDKCSSFTEDEMMDCLIAIQYWPQSYHVKAGNFLRVWKGLDSLCYNRLNQGDWSHDKILFVMDLWYKIKLSRLSNFTYHGLKKISRKCKDLTSAQMVQTLFYMSCVRKVHVAISMRDYEYYVQKHITHLSIGEIGIVALAFFKTKMTILNQKILIYMMHRVLEEIDSIDPITLTAIAKTVRLSHKPEIGFTANDFVNEVAEKRMDSLSLVGAIHILHISTQVQFFSKEPITKLAEKFCKDPSAARLKDMERIAFILSLFNYIPSSTPNIPDLILEELGKPEHVAAGNEHSLTLLSLLYYLTLLQAYGEKQIHELLDEKFLLNKYETRFMIPVQVLQIDYNRALEGPPGCKNILSPSLREYLSRRYSLFIPDENKQYKGKWDQMFAEVLKLTKELFGGEEYVMPAHALPHFPRADILFRLDENGKPLPIPEDFRNTPPFVDVIRAPDERGWHAVFLGGRNMYMHNIPKLVGEQVTKLRQLRLLGYTPIMIPSHYWMGEKNKMEYLKLKYFTKPD